MSRMDPSELLAAMDAECQHSDQKFRTYRFAYSIPLFHYHEQEYI